MYHGAYCRRDVQADRHHEQRQQHADLDHQPQHQRALAENLAPHLLVVDRVGALLHERRPLRRGEQPVGKLIALDVQPDRLAGLGLQVDDFLPLAAQVGRIQQPPASVVPHQRRERQARDRHHRQHDQQPQPRRAAPAAATSARKRSPAAKSSGTTRPATHSSAENSCSPTG